MEIVIRYIVGEKANDLEVEEIIIMILKKCGIGLKRN